MFRLSPLLATLVLGGYAAAQISTPPSATSTRTYPTASLFFPIGNPGELAASIISIGNNATAFAIGCFTPPTPCRTDYKTSTDPAVSPTASNTQPCSLNPSVTITQGLSTLIYNAPPHSKLATLPNALASVNITCAVYGAISLPNQSNNFIPATQAICAASTQIPGLGGAAFGSTTTLASGEITYVPVTVTAGGEKIASASALATAGGGSGSAGTIGVTSSGAAVGARVTGMVAMRWAALVRVVGLGVMAGL